MQIIYNNNFNKNYFEWEKCDSADWADSIF